jgi:capsular exopolysaccharide synthesis family protein
VTALVVGAAVGFTLRQTPVYTSDARVLVLPVAPANSPWSFLVEINMDTESGLVDSVAVATLVQKNLGETGNPANLLGGLEVSVEGATEILDISYTDPDPAEAKLMAQVFAESYLQFRQQQALEQVKTQIESVTLDIERVTAKISEDQAALNATTDPAVQQELQAAIEQSRARLIVLQGNLEELKSTTTQSGGQIVEPAYLPDSPSNAGLIQNGLLALILGLALGIGLAFLRERLDDRLRTQEDLERAFGASVLAVVPRVQGWSDKKKTRLVAVEAPRAPAAEAYRTLRTNLLFMASQRPLKTNLIVSPSAGDGKTTTAANLAVVLAQTGKNVVLVSADLRKPRIHRFFGLDNDRGLVQVLEKQKSLDEVLVQTSVEGLRLLPCGAVPAQPAELLHSEEMRTLLDRLGEMADFVVIGSAPSLVVSDSLALAALTDGVLLVAQAVETTRQTVSRARDQLEAVGAVMVGAVLNSFDPSSAHGRYYYSSRYYRYGYAGKYGSAYPAAQQQGNGASTPKREEAKSAGRSDTWSG